MHIVLVLGQVEQKRCGIRPGGVEEFRLRIVGTERTTQHFVGQRQEGDRDSAAAGLYRRNVEG